MSREVITTMQSQENNKYVSAVDKIKYYEALSKGRCGTEQKFRSKVYSPTPYSNISIATQACSVNKAAFDVNQNGIHTEGDSADTGQISEAQHFQVTNDECLTSRDDGSQSIEGEVAEVVRDKLTEEVTGKSAEINDSVAANNTSTDEMKYSYPYSQEKLSEIRLVEETGKLDAVIGITDDQKDKDISPEVIVANSVEKPDVADKEDIEASNDPKMTCEDLSEIGTRTEQTGCKRKPAVRSKLPVKASNKDPQSTPHKQLKYAKEEHPKLASLKVKQDERTIVSGFTNHLNMPKIYDELMERKKNFEIQTDKLEADLEMQLRKLCDILETLKAKTKETEAMVGDFVDTITAFPDIKFEAESTHVLDIHSIEKNTDGLLEKNANVNTEIREWLDEIKEKRVASLDNLQQDIMKMNHFLELLKQSNETYCKTGTLIGERTRSQHLPMKKMIKTTKLSQNQKPDLAYISKEFEQNRNRNENLDFKILHESSVVDSEVQDIKICGSFRENCYQKDAKGYDFGSSINACLDLAHSSSVKEGLKSKREGNKSTFDIVRGQRSEEKLVSSNRAKERKTKIPKPIWQAYQNVSRDRKQAGDLFESGDHFNTAQTENGGSSESNLTLQNEDTSYCSPITDNCTLAKDNTKQHSYRLNTKDVKAKIDTGLKTSSNGKIKRKSKNILH